MFTVGTAVYNDTDRALFTVMSSKIIQGDLVSEFIVVDNDPNSQQGQLLRTQCQNNPKVRYIPFADVVGTSVPRNVVFREAKAEYVVVVDSHVIMYPGALASLAEFYTSAPQCPDIFHGPMMAESGQTHSTHMNDQWRDTMWGTWARAWTTKDGIVFSPRDPGVGNMIEFVTMSWPQKLIPREIIGYPQHGGWAQHEAVLRTLGCTELGDQDAPFEIPGYGCGLIACRKDSWIGFPDDARGFGGEEMSVHVQHRQAGRKVWCIPQLRWWHNFLPPGTPRPYQARLWDKVRNYVIWFRKLNLPLEPVHEEFVKRAGMPEHEFHEAVAGAPWPSQKADNWVPPPSDRLPPATPLPVVIDQPIPPVQPVKLHGCAQTGETGEQLAARNLQAQFEYLKKTPSDINEHLDTLKNLVANATRVVELGTRTGVSTTALMAGKPTLLYTYDINAAPVAEQLSRFAEGIDYRVIKGDSTQVDIPDCDLLLVDTDPHTAERVWAELFRHAPKVSRYIVLHDTVTFGEMYGDQPGVLQAVRGFLRNNPEWTSIRHDVNNNGLLVLSKHPDDKKTPPGMLQKLLNVSRAVTKHVADGMSKTSDDEYDKRIELCMLCPSRNHDVCAECGCPILKKAAFKTEKCPLGKWT